MPRRFQNILQNFATGAVSPRMAARADFEAYSNSLKEAKNFIISTQGGAAFREGMQYIGRPPSNQPFRLFQFRRGGDASDILVEVSEGLIRYWIENELGSPELYADYSSLLLDEDTGDFLVDELDGAFLTTGVALGINPYNIEDLETLYFTNQDKYAVLCHPEHPPIYITLEKDGSIVVNDISSERIPLFAYNDINSPTQVAADTDWIITFPPEWDSTVWLYGVVYHGVSGLDPNGYQLLKAFNATGTTNAQNIEDMLNAAAARQTFSTTFTVTPIAGSAVSGGSTEMAYAVAISGEPAGYDVRAYRYWNYNLQQGYANPIVALNEPITERAGTGDSVVEPAWSYPTYVYNSTTGHYYKCLRVHKAATADNKPGEGTDWEAYWLDLGIRKPDGFDYQYPSGNEWAELDASSNVITYAPWNRGFPTVCQFHDQRLLLMANKDNPTAVYGSRLGAFSDFTIGVNDDDPFLFVLDSSDTPQIKWAVSQGNLTLGTSSGEWSLTADVTITPTDVHAEQQNYARSFGARPVLIDVEIIYIEAGQRKIRATRYTDDSKAYSSQDLSIFAEHLVSESGVKTIACGYIPELCMLGVRNNGQPIILTYERSMPILAFSEMETDGSVYDISGYFSFSKNRDFYYFASERNDNYFLERMRYPCSKLCENLTANEVVFLDSFVTGTVTGDTIDGLDHLEGKTVSVLVDEAWQIGTFTVKAGAITLPEDESGKAYAIGLPYEGVLQTFEVVDNGRTTGFGTKRRWNKLTTRLLNSSLPKVYTDRAADRTPPVPMGTPETIREGLQDVTQSVVGYGDASITIVQDRPYPVYILGFFGEYQVEDR